MGRILILAPHADDEVIGCGGLMAVSQNTGVVGVDVAVVCIGNPVSGAQVDESTRMSEMYAAHKLLGVRNTYILYPGKSGFLDTVSMFDIVGKIDSLCKWGYDEIYYPATCHMHDHRVVNEACRAAFRPGTKRAKLIAEYEHNWPGWSMLTGNGYLDITYVIDRKLEAMQLYGSQLARHANVHNHPLSLEAIRRVAAMRGLECGVEYAERFNVVYAKW